MCRIKDRNGSGHLLGHSRGRAPLGRKFRKAARIFRLWAFDVDAVPQRGGGAGRIMAFEMPKDAEPIDRASVAGGPRLGMQIVEPRVGIGERGQKIAKAARLLKKAQDLMRGARKAERPERVVGLHEGYVMPVLVEAVVEHELGSRWRHVIAQIVVETADAFARDAPTPLKRDGRGIEGELW